MKHYITTKLKMIGDGKFTIEHEHHHLKTTPVLGFSKAGNLFNYTQEYSSSLIKQVTENEIINYAFSK